MTNELGQSAIPCEFSPLLKLPIKVPMFQQPCIANGSCLHITKKTAFLISFSLEIWHCKETTICVSESQTGTSSFLVWFWLRLRGHGISVGKKGAISHVSCYTAAYFNWGQLRGITVHVSVILQINRVSASCMRLLQCIANCSAYSKLININSNHPVVVVQRPTYSHILDE